MIDGHVVGAIGVSGNTPQEDEEIAKAGAAALTNAIRADRPPVSYWNSAEVAAAFAKGSVLFGAQDGRNYMVHASHREGPGMAEVHELDADIIYVLEGSATFVTGGMVDGARTTEPYEIRGSAIRGGEERRIAKGDVLIVPNGTPHWFKDVSGPLNYYAEVWVDGRLPIALGQTGGQLIKGFNAPNRVVIARDAVPGQRIQLAVFGVNGPLSSPPANFVWVRSASLDFYRKDRVGRLAETKAEIKRVDPALDDILPESPTLEKLAEGFIFTEGPVWVPDGHLLFSDPNANTIYRWSPDGQVSVFRPKSG